MLVSWKGMHHEVIPIFPEKKKSKRHRDDQSSSIVCFNVFCDDSVHEVICVAVSNICYFHHYLGKMNPFWRAYFSIELVQPPTSYLFALLTICKVFWIGESALWDELGSVSIAATIQSRPFSRVFSGSPQIMGPLEMVSFPYELPISLGIRTWEWYGNSMGNYIP